LNASLVCTLCNGYFRSAHTIMECLHTYCKSCIYNYLREKLTLSPPDPDCPRCGIKLETSDPFVKCVRYDRVMQNIVDKIFPQFEREDVERLISEQGDTKKQKSGTSLDVKKTFDQQSKITFEIVPHEQQQQQIELENGDASTDAKSNRFKSNIPSTFLSTITKSEPASSFKPLPPLPKQFLRSSDQTVVKSLKIFVANKLGIDPNLVDLLCCGEVLGTDHSLEFVKKTRWHDNDRILCLTYRLRPMLKFPSM